MTRFVPFNRPSLAGRELACIQQAIAGGHLSGNGPFTKKCQKWLEERLGVPRALLTHSCTGALEMAALLTGVGPGDEVIMPSFTFVSTANAFALRGATPVFVDVRPDTLNLDEDRLEAAITDRTRAIVPVHYAGVGCEMDAICRIAQRHDLLVIEDAAQGVMAGYRGRPLGSIGAAAAVSFHETKNVMAGEGGALILNRPEWLERAEVLWEKGTNRSAFERGVIDRYSWVDLGSSYLPSEINAAFLWAQLEHAEAITRRRLDIWEIYHERLAPLEASGLLRRPVLPDGCTPNAHMYYVLVAEPALRPGLMAVLTEHGINAVTHYVPLHLSKAGRRFGRTAGPLDVTENVAERILRLPLWVAMTDQDIDAVMEGVADWVRRWPVEKKQPRVRAVNASSRDDAS
jgi:dTDP-4-amino-4,6-dideoxygalactose transaminase